jgi:DNA invertase Pin-like site-specific DNA recombinase
MRGHTKITASHLGRRALIYVRQSTLAQVRNNTESTARQYGQSELAARLGWAAADIEVIDTDLGLSGQLAEGRAGFKEVVGRVCLGEAGAIFGLEVSRLARSSADLAKLLELARLTDTLVIDADGVYDLSDINDRMLLGLKNQMAEVELHILASRMDKAKRSAAARGELQLQLPAGFARDDEGAIAIDPDQEVQAAVGDLFTAFTATGSAYGVVGAFAGRRFPRRSQSGELTWAPLTYDRVLKVLSNPAYAGAYVFGRRRSRGGWSPPTGGSPAAAATCHGPNGRRLSSASIPATSPGTSSWLTRRNLRQTTPTPEPARYAKALPSARASSTAVAAAGR